MVHCVYNSKFKVAFQFSPSKTSLTYQLFKPNNLKKLVHFISTIHVNPKKRQCEYRA